MKITKALRELREELCFTQVQLADALKVNYTTVSRWENGKSIPSHGMAVAIIRYANDCHVSLPCIEQLKSALLIVKRGNLRSTDIHNEYVDYADLIALIDNANLPIYVCDYETDELLYVNSSAEIVMGFTKSESIGKKCYACLMNRTSACDFCWKEELCDSEVKKKDLILPNNKRVYQVGGILIKWRGRKAHVHFITGMVDEVRNSGIILNTIIQNLPGAVVSIRVDERGAHFVYLSDGCFNFTGYNAEECLRLCEKDNLFFAYKEDREMVKVKIDNCIKNREEYVQEFRIQSRTKQLYWVKLSLSPVEIDGVLHYNGIYIDSSKEHEANERYRKAAEDANAAIADLRSHHAMLKEAMTSAKVLTWRYNYKTKTITDSSSLGIKLGLPHTIEDFPNCIIKKGFVTEDTVEAYRSMFEQMKNGEKVSCEMCMSEWVYGKKVWTKEIYTPLFDIDGNYVESIGTGIDITEQKEREETYNEQVYLKHMLAGNSLAICHYNLTKNHIIDYGGKEPRLLKIIKSSTANEVIQGVYQSIAEEKEKQKFSQIKDCKAMIKYYKEGNTHYSLRHHLKGDDRWVETIYDYMSNPNNGDVEAIGVLQDISDIVRVENVLRVLTKIDYESITTINAITGEAHPLTRGHLDDVIAEQEQKKDNVAGVEAYLRKYCKDVDVERVIKETSLPYVKKILEKQNIHTVTYSLYYPEGIIHKRVIYCYLDNSKKQILCAMQDISETYRLEEEQKKRLSIALEDAQKANHAKTDFFSRMSHDMRTPMNGILGLTQLSEDENDINILKSNIAKIDESGKYLLSLINDTLDFQRIESGKMELSPQIVPTQSLFENVKDIINAAANLKNIDFQIIDKNIDLEWYINVDPVRLKQIFINLLSNAVKFTPEGGKIRLILECLGNDGDVNHDKIIVMDSGIGMSKEFIENGLFHPFSQETNEVSGKYAGSGLGLSIVHSLVEMMGGKIEVTSEIGSGTTFEVYLNLQRVKKSEVEQIHLKNEKSWEVANNLLEGKTILLVEDHPLNAEIMIRLLEKQKGIVVWMENGKNGVDAFKNSELREFDAILMDIRMPVMNGLEASRAIRTLNRADAKSVPIIALTANAYEGDIKETKEAGMNCHLSKPVEVAKLYESLKKFLHVK